MSDKDQAIGVHLAEFAALRAEILNCQTAQFSITVGVVALVGAVLTFTFTKDESSSLASYSWAVIAAICSLGLLYCDLNRRIVRCARYIHRYLKPHISTLLQESTDSVLRWEDYHRGQLEGLAPLPAFVQDQGHTFQSFIFLLPAAGFYAAAMNHLQVGNAWLLMAYITDAIILIFLGITLYKVKDNRISSPEEDRKVQFQPSFSPQGEITATPPPSPNPHPRTPENPARPTSCNETAQAAHLSTN